MRFESSSSITLAAAVVLCLASQSFAANPSDALDPVFAEYDVDATWPKRPAACLGRGLGLGMAIDGSQQVWFFRKGPDPVQVYKTDGTFVRTWGKGQFKDPHHLRIDREGNIWLADFGSHVIQKFTTEGKLLLTLGAKDQPGEDTTHFYRPTDMVLLPSGEIFVTDGYGNRRVVHFDKEGKFVKTWGKYGVGPTEFVMPHAIAADSKGRLYVADRNSARILVFDQSGKSLDVWSGLIMPWGLFINAQDEIWVCGSTPHWWYRDGKYTEYKDQVLMKFSPDGRVQRVYTLSLGEKKETLKPGQTIGAHCLVEDAGGNLYVGDIYGERAQKFVPAKTHTAADKAALLGVK